MLKLILLILKLILLAVVKIFTFFVNKTNNKIVSIFNFTTLLSVIWYLVYKSYMLYNEYCIVMDIVNYANNSIIYAILFPITGLCLVYMYRK